MERRRRRFWTITITVVSSLIVLAALVSGAFQLVVRAAPGYRVQLQEQLGELLGRPVVIGDLRLTWRGYYPSLDIDRITLLATPSAPDAVSADRLRLAFSLPRLAAGDWMPARIDLVGAELAASRDAEGRLHVRGFQPSKSAPSGNVLERLRQIAYLRVLKSSVVWTDEPLKMAGERFEIVRGELDQGDQHFELDLELGLPPSLGQSLSVHAELDGDLARTSTWSGPWAIYLRGVGDGPLIHQYLAPGVRLAVDRARLRLKGDLVRGKVPQVLAEWESGPINAERGIFRYHLNGFAVAADIKLEENGWAAEIPRIEVQGEGGAWPETALMLKFARTEGGFDFSFSTDFVRLGDVAPWLNLLQAPPREVAALHDASGDVERLSWRWRRRKEGDQYAVAASLRNLHLAGAGRPLGFANLTGDLSADESGGRIKLRDVPLWFELPRAFTSPGQFDALSAMVTWKRENEDWRVRAPDLKWRLAGSEGHGAVSVFVPRDGSPVLDLNVKVMARDATRFKAYIPTVWGKDLHRWLTDSILAARVPAGELTIKGPLADFPFHKTRNGTFLLELDVADAHLKFHPDWPAVERAAARLKFEGNSLHITTEGAAMLGARISKATARFDDFRDARLIIDGDVGGDLSKLYRVIEASPLEKTLGALVHHTRATGAASVNLHLDIPLSKADQTLASGRVRVRDASLVYQALKEPIRGIAGEVHFGPAGVSSESLTGQFYEVPLQAKITAITPKLSRLRANFRYAPRADGTGVSTLVPAWILPQLSGGSAWAAELDIGAEASAALRLSTDLQGVSIRFPAPLAKRAEEVEQLRIGFSGDEKIALRIGVDYADRFGADLQFTGVRDQLALSSALLRVGAGPVVATEPGVVVIGHAPELDLGAWSAALAGLTAGNDAGAPAVKRVEISTDRPILAGRALLPLSFVYTPLPNGWSADVRGQGAEGRLNWRDVDGGTLSGRLQHIVLDFTDLDPPADPKRPQRAPLEPAKLPILDLECASLKVGGLDFGRLRFSTERVPGGQRLRQLQLEGGAVALTGSGQWWRRNDASGANLSFHLASERTADVLQALEYTPNVTAKKATFDADLLWAPNPTGIEFAQARGHLALQMENGNLKAIEPGAGRVLGLLNFYALPRRLTLNFRDVVGQGLGFDKITGTFDLGDGDARTEDLAIAGPSVRMETRGRIGLSRRDYDQIITVYPDMSSGITLGALLLGGPALGALALVAQQVLDKPLEEVTQLTYHLGGTWDNPEIRKGDGSPVEETKTRRRAEAGKP
jgi:uncharacterized protein (TIGR02099 family)